MARQTQEWFWLLFYGVILLSWLALLVNSAVAVETAAATLASPEFWISVLTTQAQHHSPFVLLLMWMLMSAAMMLPSLAPVVLVYEDLRIAGAGSQSGAASLLAGYLSCWMIFAAGMALIHYLAAMVSHPGSAGLAGSWLAASIVLAAAGLYQFSTLKERCLAYCRNPLVVFLARGETGLGGEFATGFKFGMICVGCCWLLMAICLITGMMSLAWMGLATLFITLEKLPALGRYVSRPLGGCLVAASAVIAASSI
ncbi:MAG: DUF2182 domain-containing protein, partial [Rhodobacteraceae bacterium]|nr:DUF2182 domain-containing protein [Paracoccaceae bacterium]